MKRRYVIGRVGCYDPHERDPDRRQVFRLGPLFAAMRGTERRLSETHLEMCLTRRALGTCGDIKCELTRKGRQFSTKQRGSNNRERSRKHLARQHRKIARQREEHHWKLALVLVRPFDVLFFEDLNLEGMKRLWGRKVSDIGFYAFMQKIKYQATKRGKRVETIDRWQPTTTVCHVCENRVELELSDRTWTCEHCPIYHDRDINAAINILKVGALTFGVEGVRLAIASDPC